jgi:predicted HTH transcriptional regulator
MALGSVSRQEYQDLAGRGISMRTAQYDLQQMVQLGLMRKEGRGPAQRYVIVQPGAQAPAGKGCP